MSQCLTHKWSYVSTTVLSLSGLKGVYDKYVCSCGCTKLSLHK